MHYKDGQGPIPEMGPDPYADYAGMNPEQMAHMPPPYGHGYPWAHMPPPEAMPYYGYPHPGYMPPPPYPPGYGHYPPGMPPHMQPQQPPSAEQLGLQEAFNDMADKSGLGMLKGMFKMDDSEFWKGALVGAAAVMLLTNEGLRESLMSGASKTAEAMKSGFNGFGNPEASDQEADHNTDPAED